MTDPATPVLEVSGLTVSITRGGDRPRAVEDVSFSVNRGEVLCLVGESGSGKSVTAFSIMGLLNSANLKITAGSIRLQGEELVSMSPARLRELRGLRMSMVFQEPMTALNPVIRVGEQIAEVIRWHSRTLSKAAVADQVLRLMQDVHLPDPERMRDAYPHQLSGGQRQRIVIAMALALKPALIIADEPTTALDVTTQAQILSLLRELQVRYQTGILFITHDFGVVAEIADRAIVMRGGRIVESGPAVDVLTAPKHSYTQMLLAAVPRAAPRPPQFAASAPTILAIDKLSKTYRDGGLLRRARTTHAVDGVSFALKRGEILGVVGESGSGKSTLARCVSRLMDATSGSIVVDGNEIGSASTRALRPYRRRIQMVFQDPYRSLNPRRTVGQSICEGVIEYGIPPAEAEQRAARLLTLVGLDPAAASRYPHQFSGGQRQRVCIARALAMEPEILVADEAVSALDVSVQAQVLDLLDELRKRLDLAIIFITHDLRVAARLCDTLAVMYRGKVVEYGAASSVFANPQHDYTQALFAAAPGGKLLASIA